jgi:hypothetical protein
VGWLLWKAHRQCLYRDLYAKLYPLGEGRETLDNVSGRGGADFQKVVLVAGLRALQGLDLPVFAF